MDEILEIGDIVTVVGHHKLLKMAYEADPNVESRLKTHFQGIPVEKRDGIVESIKTESGCEYEEETGDLAAYLVKFIDGPASWKGSHLHFYRDELKFVRKATGKELEMLKEKVIDEAKVLKKMQHDKYQK